MVRLKKNSPTLSTRRNYKGDGSEATIRTVEFSFDVPSLLDAPGIIPVRDPFRPFFIYIGDTLPRVIFATRCMAWLTYFMIRSLPSWILSDLQWGLPPKRASWSPECVQPGTLMISEPRELRVSPEPVFWWTQLAECKTGGRLAWSLGNPRRPISSHLSSPLFF